MDSFRRIRKKVMSFSSESITKEQIYHDDDIATLINRILTAPVVYTIPTDDTGLTENQKVYELRVDISSAEIFSLCKKSKTAFMASDVLLRVDGESPIHVVADLHGQLIHLLRIIRTCGAPPTQRYIFLGDYVDRGVQGVPLICLLLAMKIRYPQQIFLLRGNHEDVNTTLNYGFYDECLTRYGEGGVGEEIWYAFMDVFNCLPLAAVLGSQVFCSHGGISPFMNTIDDINKISRPSIVPAFGLACDLLWSDPAPSERDGWTLSHRGISFTYGYDIVEEFCNRNNISLIIRGHQLFKELYTAGYVIRFGGRLISLFSALNYENHRNNAAVIKIEFEKKMEVTPIVFRCRHYIPQKQYDTISYRDLEIMRRHKVEMRPNPPTRLPSAKFNE